MAMLLSAQVIGQNPFNRTAGGFEFPVTTPLGTIVGRYDRNTGNGVARFHGLPYGTAERFGSPTLVTTYDGGHFDAVSSVSCAQAGTNPQGLVYGIEDCLTIDLITPTAGGMTPFTATVAPSGTYPVQFWIHGGGMSFESFPIYTYKDAYWAANDYSYMPNKGKCITATVHYRLFTLGFSSHPFMKVGDASYGNMGLLDLITGLQWTQRYIGYFGGDASKVTIHGESAGATLTGLLVVSPLAQGLFSGAVSESIWNLNSGVMYSQSARDDATMMMIAGAGCHSMAQPTAAELPSVKACMMAAPVQNILFAPYFGNETEWNNLYGPFPAAMWWGLYNGWQGWGAYPVIDGYALTKAPLDLIADGMGKDVAWIMGENSEEWGIYVADASGMFPLADFGMFSAIMKTDESTSLADFLMAYVSQPAYEDTVANFFGAVVDPYEKYIAAASAGYFSFNIGMLVDGALAQPGRTKGVYRYVYAEGTFFGPMAPRGAYHAAELNYIWGFHIQGTDVMAESLPAKDIPYSPELMAMGESMHAYWTNFFYFGEPNAQGDGLEDWEAQVPGAKHTMMFKAEIPKGAALDPCAMLISCLAEPYLNFRENLKEYYKSSYTSSAPLQTCDMPTVGFSRTVGPHYYENCTIPISPMLPCCAASRRSLLFGAGVVGGGAACRPCTL